MNFDNINSENRSVSMMNNLIPGNRLNNLRNIFKQQVTPIKNGGNCDVDLEKNDVKN